MKINFYLTQDDIISLIYNYCECQACCSDNLEAIRKSLNSYMVEPYEIEVKGKHVRIILHPVD